jgi:hypothetical protein
VSGYGKPFTGRMIGCMWIEYGLESHFERLRAKGMLTLDEMAQRLDISTQQLKTCRAVGLVRAHLCNDKNEYLDEPGADPSIHRSITESQWRETIEGSKRPQLLENVAQRPSEVRCEA